MNIAKKNKVVSFVMLAVMLIVFVTTAGLLAVLQKNNNNYSPEASPVADYTIDAPVRNSNTIKWVDVNSHSDAWINFQYPSQIYLDKGKGETLDSVGYYFYVDCNFSNGMGRVINFINATFGYCDGSYNGTPVSTAWADKDWYAFMRLFDYGLEYQSVNNTWGKGTGTTNTNGLQSASVIYVGASGGSNFQWKYMMTGGIKSTTGTGNYKYKSVPNDNPKVTTNYLYKNLSGNYGETVGFKYGRTDSREMDGVNTTFTDGMDIDIYIYDKNELGSLVAGFKTRIAKDKTILDKINGGDSAYKHAESFISNIETNILKKREVTQAQINTAVNQINDYKYQINVPVLNSSKVYDGENFNIESNAFSSYDSRYFDVQLLDKNGSPLTAETMVNVEDYKIKVTLKSEVNGSKFAWADGSGNATKEFNYKITPRPFTAQVGDQTFKYKVSNYNVVIDPIYNNHVNEALNPIIIEWSRDQKEWTTGNIIEESEVGIYTIYYRITSTNHQDINSSFTLSIDKADIVLYTKSLTHIYGDSVPTQEDILNEIIDWDNISIFDAVNEEQKRNYLIGGTDTSGVLSSIAIAKDGIAVDALPNVGRYDLLIEKNSAFDKKANISFAQNGDGTAMNVGVYIVNPRSIKINWAVQDNMWYDGTDKKPVASIDDNENLYGQTVGINVTAKKDSAGTVLTKAIDAGVYIAQAEIDDNDNFVIEEGLETQGFTILKRVINVNLKDKIADYGEHNAAEFWASYIAEFEKNKNNEVYELTLDASVTDGKDALGGSDAGYEVFEILLKDANYSDDSANKYLLAGRYTLEPSILSTGAGRNYVFNNITNGECIVNDADINFSLTTLPSLVFKGVAQEIGLNKLDQRIAFKGWENANRDGVTLCFATNEDDLDKNPTEKFEVTNAGDYTIYYKITAPNHNDLTGSITLKVEKAAIYIDVSGQTTEFIYGNRVPTSNELITLLGISFSGQNGELEIPNLNERIIFHLLDGSGSGHYQPGDEITVDSYTVSHALGANEDSNNYTIAYRQNEDGTFKNVKAFKVSQKELNVDWTQNGEGWNFNQAKNKWEFTYNGNTPNISVKAADGEVAFDDEISLSTTINGKTVGQYNATTALTKPYNQTNYKLVNDTFEFEIVQLDVTIKVDNIERKFGQAQQNRPIGSDIHLLAPGSEGAIWDYADGSATFIGDDYRNFCFISDAIVANGFQNVGEYAINIAPLAGTSGEITKNYNVIIENTPKFTIIATDIIYNGVRFNVDFEDSDAIRVITKDIIKRYISLDQFNGIVTADNFDIYMSDLKENTDKSNTWVDQISLSRKPTGDYYFSLKIVYNNSTYKNFNDFEYEVEVNISQGWISVTINGNIIVTYGDTMMLSPELYDELKDKIEITGLDDMTPEEAFEFIKGIFSIHIGSSDGILQSNGRAGKYSIYFDNPNANGRKIRFMNDSNIEAYIINAKELEMDWDDMVIDEVYGEHTTNSPSHECVTRLKLVNGDTYPNIKAIEEYQMLVGDEWVTVSDHARNVGRYRVVITGVNSDNYFVKEGALVKEFEITKAKIKIKLNDRDSIVYGDENSSKEGIIKYLNNIPDGSEQPFEIIEGKFCYKDNAADIFSYQLKETLETGNYFNVNTYTIVINQISNNYEIEFETGSVEVTAATIEYTRAQFAPRLYTGEGIKVEPMDGNIYYVLRGDIKDATVEYKIKGLSEDFTSDLYVTNAGKYEILIKITAQNHIDFIMEEEYAVNFEVKQVHVEIKMSQKDKVYGDTENEILADANVGSFHEWLVKECKITFEFYTLDEGNNRVPVTGEQFKKDFVFKVIQNAQGGKDPIEVGKNKVGTYTVIHETDGEFADKMKNYIVNYYQGVDMPYRCNYDAYNIVARQVEVVWTGNEFTYNGKSQKPTASVKAGDLIGDDTCTIIVGGEQVNAGTYTASATLSNNNYTIASNATFKFVINQKSVEVVWTGNEFTYNGKSQAPTASVKAGDLIGDDTCGIVVSGGQVNVGPYTATATLLNKNYIIASNATFGFVINPKSITFTWADDVLVYNGNKQAPKAIASGLVDGDSVEFAIDGAEVKAGTGYIARVTGIKDNANYIVDSDAMNNTKVFSIQKAKNEFVQIDNLPDKLDKLPWINGGKPVSKYGDVVVKYFSDEECTQEVTDITKAGKGKYWIVVSVADTDNYESITRTFEVEITGDNNMVGIIAGSVAGGVALLAIIAVTIVLVIKKKKKA